MFPLKTPCEAFGFVGVIDERFAASDSRVEANFTKCTLHSPCAHRLPDFFFPGNVNTISCEMAPAIGHKVFEVLTFFFGEKGRTTGVLFVGVFRGSTCSARTRAMVLRWQLTTFAMWWLELPSLFAIMMLCHCSGVSIIESDQQFKWRNSGFYFIWNKSSDKNVQICTTRDVMLYILMMNEKNLTSKLSKIHYRGRKNIVTSL
jgi:hypothetical protein